MRRPWRTGPPTLWYLGNVDGRRCHANCEPTAHRFVFSDSASLRFCRLGPTAHRFDWWQRQLLFATLGRWFAPVPPLPASVPVTTRETSQIGGRTRAALPDHRPPVLLARDAPDRQCRPEPPRAGVEGVGSGRHSRG